MTKLTVRTLILLTIIGILSFNLFAQTRIRFPKGKSSTTVSGQLNGNADRSYALGARSDQYLSATISSRRDCVTFDNGETSISFNTDQGDNYLYLSNTCAARMNFTFTVSINNGGEDDKSFSTIFLSDRNFEGSFFFR